VWGLRSLNAAFPCWSCVSFFNHFISQRSQDPYFHMCHNINANKWSILVILMYLS
jgi:hypothetical protein